MKSISNDKIDKSKLINNEIDKKKKKRLRKKKRTSIQKRKLIDTLFTKHISTESIYILTLCCQ